MKTRNRIKTTFLLLLMLLFSFGSIDSFARNRNGNTRTGACCMGISDLTAEQQENLKALRDSHLQKMETFRNQRRSTVDLAEKLSIRNKMLAEVEQHRLVVRNKLTPEQQKQYDQLQKGRGNNRQAIGKGRSSRNGRGSGNRARGRGRRSMNCINQKS